MQIKTNLIMNNLISQIQITQLLINKGSKVINQAQPHEKLSKLQKDFQIDLQTYPSGIKEQLEYIIVKLLEYPSTQLAITHQNANRLGKYDIKQETEETQDQQSNPDKKYCQDCGQIIQKQDISACTPFEAFPIIGLSTYLFFDNIKNLLVLICILGAVYSAYSLYININQSLSSIAIDDFVGKISFASIVKNLTTNDELYFAIAVQGWIIVGIVLVWWVTLFIMKYALIKKQRMIDNQTVTAADFGVMIENIPIQITKTQLQIEFDAYYRLIIDKKMLQQEQIKPFQITNVVKAIPFYDLDDESIKYQISNIQEKLQEQRQNIAALVKEIKNEGKFSSTYDQRKKMYEDYLQLQIQKVKHEKKLQQLSKDMKSLQAKHLKTIFFITFKHSQSANIIGDLNPYSFSQKLRYYLSCCRKGLPFKIDSPQTNELVLRRAPEPEDIIWWNIGIPNCSIVLRKFITNIVTMILIGSSFGIVYGLTSLQRIYTDSTMISIIASLTITITNILISISIRKLTHYQCDITQTQRQIGLATKSIFAQLINSILTPVITNIYIDNNIYDTNGLVYDIFYLSISSSLVPPVMKFINIPEIIKKIMICYYDRPKNKLSMDQKDLNEIYENKEYELGFAYIYFVNQFYFTCFYVPIQPGIVVFTIIGFILMYWAEKKDLLGYSKRPNPGTNLLNDAMGQLIYLAPCVLSVSMFVWFSVIREEEHNFSNVTYLSHLIAIWLAAMFFILPFNSIFKAACYIADDQDLIYSEAKQLFTSDYDLANPVTRNDAINELMKKQLQQPNKNQNKSNIALKKALGATSKLMQESMLQILQGNIQQQQQIQSIEDIIEKPIEKPLISRVPRRQQNIAQESINLQTDYNDDRKNITEQAIKIDQDQNFITKCTNFQRKRRSRKSNPTVEDSVSHLYKQLIQQRIRSSNGFDNTLKKTPYDELHF